MHISLYLYEILKDPEAKILGEDKIIEKKISNIKTQHISTNFKNRFYFLKILSYLVLFNQRSLQKKATLSRQPTQFGETFKIYS